jgi:hypothetical protein
MRPLHPLPPPVTQVSSSRSKKRKVVPPTRARRQKIDPTLYGSVHTTEAMLQADHVVVLPVALPVGSPAEPSLVVKPPAARGPVDQKNTLASEELHDAIDDTLVNPFEAERQKDLGLLAFLFDGKEKWEGREDDLDGLEDLILEGRPPNDPKETNSLEETTRKDTVQSHGDEDSQSRESSPSPPPPSPPTESTTRLKDLFALRTTGEMVSRHRHDLTFSSPEPLSILHGLDLDLEDDFALDETMNADLPTEQVGSRLPLLVDDSRPQVQRKGLEQVQFSNTVPYFFPLDPSERSRGTVKDIMAISAAKGWMQPLLNPMMPYVLSYRRSMT